MSFVKTVVFLLVLQFRVEISWALSFTRNVVVGPLAHDREMECAAKAIYTTLFGGGSPVSGKRGRATPWMTRTFDSTMGFPGEDVT